MTQSEKVIRVAEILKKRFNNLSAIELVKMATEIVDSLEEK